MILTYRDYLGTLLTNIEVLRIELKSLLDNESGLAYQAIYEVSQEITQSEIVRIEEDVIVLRESIRIAKSRVGL